MSWIPDETARQLLGVLPLTAERAIDAADRAMRHHILRDGDVEAMLEAVNSLIDQTGTGDAEKARLKGIRDTILECQE